MCGQLFIHFLCNQPVLSTCCQTPAGSLKEVLEQLLEAIVSYTDPSGRLISELFQKLPSKLVSPLTACSENIYSLTLISWFQIENLVFKQCLWLCFSHKSIKMGRFV